MKGIYLATIPADSARAFVALVPAAATSARSPIFLLPQHDVLPFWRPRNGACIARSVGCMHAWPFTMSQYSNCLSS